MHNYYCFFVIAFIVLAVAFRLKRHSSSRLLSAQRHESGKNTLIVEAIIFEYQKSKVGDKGLALEVGKYSNGAFSAFNSSDLVDLASLPAGLVASFIKADSFASDIITNTRSITTNVQVKPGQVIQRGGLVSSDTSDTVSKVPFFSKIPLLGRLFRSTSNDDRQVELTVFLRVKFV